MSETQALHSQFLADLQALQAQGGFEALATKAGQEDEPVFEGDVTAEGTVETATHEHEWLDDPSQSLNRKIYDELQNVTITSTVKTEIGELSFYPIKPFTPENTNSPNQANLTYHDGCRIMAIATSRHIVEYSEKIKAHDDDNVMMGRMVPVIQRELLASTDFGAKVQYEKYQGLTMLSLIAASTKPPDVAAGEMPLKHKGEPSNHKTYRMALEAIGQIAEKNLSPIEQDGQLFYTQRERERQQGIVRNEEEHRQLAMLAFGDRLQLQNFASKMRDHLLTDQVTASGTNTEIRVWLDEANQLAEEASQPTRPEAPADPPIIETNWTILPPEMVRELGLATEAADEKTPGAADTSSANAERFVNMERMRWLGRLALDWGNGAYIAVADMQKAGQTDYRVAVLPDETPDGIPIKHAVAENPSSKNAGFVFRGERGIDEQTGEVWLTWEDVFNGGKKHAESYGARRMLHNENYPDNVQNYLLRDAAHLDKPGYDVN